MDNNITHEEVMLFMINNEESLVEKIGKVEYNRLLKVLNDYILSKGR